MPKMPERRTRVMADLRTGLRRAWAASVEGAKLTAREADLLRLRLQLGGVERRLTRTHRALGEFALDFLLRRDPDLWAHPETRRLLHEAEQFRTEQRTCLAQLEDIEAHWLLELRRDPPRRP